MRKKCSLDRGKPLKFETEGREFATFLRSLEQFIGTVKGHNFWNRIPFVLVQCSCRFLRSIALLRSNTLEQLEFKLEEKIGI